MTIIYKILVTVSFFFFLYPISVAGLSANYSFVLFPVVYILATGKIKIPNQESLMFICLFTLIFAIASIYQYEYYDRGFRRGISFVIFMSIFSYMFIPIDKKMVEAFKISIVSVSLYFSVHSIYLFFMHGGSGLGLEQAKNLVGSQRVGFIYLLAIWLAYYYVGQKKWHLVFKYTILLILVAGLLLTYSRSSIISLIGSFGIFTLYNCLKWIARPNLKLLGKGLVSIMAVTLLIWLTYLIIPRVFTFFELRLFEYISDHSAVIADLTNPLSSGGTRIVILGKIFDFITQNPFTGSGFLGVWILSETLSGSAHNQLADVLFRTGILGFGAYIYLIFRMLQFLYLNERALFWGLTGLLIYGTLHETFKESQGGFVLAFLLGMMNQSLIGKNRFAQESVSNDFSVTDRSYSLGIKSNYIPT